MNGGDLPGTCKNSRDHLKLLVQRRKPHVVPGDEAVLHTRPDEVVRDCIAIDWNWRNIFPYHFP